MAKNSPEATAEMNERHLAIAIMIQAKIVESFKNIPDEKLQEISVKERLEILEWTEKLKMDCK